jgi:hypothetical protein
MSEDNVIEPLTNLAKKADPRNTKKPIIMHERSEIERLCELLVKDMKAKDRK